MKIRYRYNIELKL